jgi:hypothetical protein
MVTPPKDIAELLSKWIERAGCALEGVTAEQVSQEKAAKEAKAAAKAAKAAMKAAAENVEEAKAAAEKAEAKVAVPYPFAHRCNAKMIYHPRNDLVVRCNGDGCYLNERTIRRSRAISIGAPRLSCVACDLDFCSRCVAASCRLRRRSC